MKCLSCILTFIAAAGAVCGFHAHAALRRIGPSSSGASPVVAVWVYFIDKQTIATASSEASPRALARRRAAGYRSDGSADLPVSRQYLNGVEQMGATLRHCFKWENAASFDIPAAAVHAVSSLPYVKRVAPVGRRRLSAGHLAAHLGKRAAYSAATIYGAAFDQLSMINVPRAHEYLSYTRSAAPGRGVRIAFFDSGFRLRHRCFRHLFDRRGVIAVHDFVDRDTTVEDPDSVFNNPRHPYYRNDEHGSLVLSLVAAYDPPYYCGAAWGADFLLARTEDGYMYSASRSREVHAEEDNWAAAIVWAESLGVDIISSSLAYRDGFEDSVIIDRGNGVFDTIFSYAKGDLDGKTTIVSRAAAEAAARGVIIVNSIGNKGYEGETSLDAPADVEDVISVGMVDLFGLLDSWSSRGPTADGRDKPDLVAPGSGVFMPEVYSYQSVDSYIFEIGASFAAPLVAGVCALVKQSDPSLDAAAIRQRLYRYCRNTRGGTDLWGYGRGIPDALSSCMKPDEVYIRAFDIGGKPLAGAIVENSQGDSIASFDETGRALFVLTSARQTGIAVTIAGNTRAVRIDSTPFWKELYSCSLIVNIRNEFFKPMPGATLSGTIGIRKFSQKADSAGRILINSFFPQPLTLVASNDGYRTSDTMWAVLQELTQERTIQIFPAADSRLDLFPTVIRRHRGEKLHLRYSGPLNAPVKTLEAAIRTISGEIVWRESRPIDAPKLDIVWDCSNGDGTPASPGTYFVMLVFDGKKRREKIIIAP